MKNVVMAGVMSVVGAYVCASDENRPCYTFSYENTVNGYRYTVKNEDKKTIASSPTWAPLLKYGPDWEALVRIVGQQEIRIKELERDNQEHIKLHEEALAIVKQIPPLVEQLKQKHQAQEKD